ncbi:MAG: tRNA (adenosine(37)-N6)-dimethylallyltransferase MiaA [Flavobacteriaceae bacterium]
MKTLIHICGATAIGKTSLSISLAKAFQTEIVSCDSRQFFKEMNIGTAVPSKEELAEAPHHFIHHISIEQPYSVGDYEKESLETLSKLFKIHDIIILVGGSGLYAEALIKGLDYFPEIDPKIRLQLNEELSKKNGLEHLQQELKTVDPISYENIEIQNPHRLVRALEIYRGSGKTFSSFKNQKKVPRLFNLLRIGLEAPREIMYERINKRVDIMIDLGLLKEVENLLDKKDKNALQTVGYRELFPYFNGEISLENAIEEIKKNTRRFSKRQVTWNKKIEGINWFNFDTPHQEIIEFVKSNLKL